MAEGTNEPYGLDSALGPATPFDLVLTALAHARHTPAYDHAQIAARLLTELGFGAGNVCGICGDPSDHGGAPHSLATGDGLTRDDVRAGRVIPSEHPTGQGEPYGPQPDEPPCGCCPTCGALPGHQHPPTGERWQHAHTPPPSQGEPYEPPSLSDLFLQREAEASVALSRDPDMQTHFACSHVPSVSAYRCAMCGTDVPRRNQ